uniref:Olfactory receptor n=1 Tax=Leptobrachium leishanense TaxID=445787 RepID=A0A8C5M3J7_9ANUR
MTFVLETVTVMRTDNKMVMNAMNQTSVTKFLLLGFQTFQSVRIILLLCFLVFLFGTICGNLLIIWLVASNRSLQSPMYFFLTQLSLSDLLLTTDIVPNALYIVWNEGDVMSFSGCMTQVYFFIFPEASESFLLTIMSYDRYLAICNPLRYNTTMNSVLCITLISISWLLSFFEALIETITVAQFDFCGPNVIDHFFCDLVPLKELSCSDTHFVEVETFILSVPNALFPFVVITVSYVCIVRAVLRISTKSGRGKAFSTCSSHLAVVSIFYGTIIGIYVIPSKGKSLTVSKAVSLLYTVFTPMINPIIYSLKNKDIKDAVKKIFCKINENN